MLRLCKRLAIKQGIHLQTQQSLELGKYDGYRHKKFGYGLFKTAGHSGALPLYYPMIYFNFSLTMGIRIT